VRVRAPAPTGLRPSGVPTHGVVPPSRRDLPLILLSGSLVVLAGLMIAGVLWLSTSRSGGPPEQYEPFPAGPAEAIKRSLEDGGPYYVPDPFGGSRSILLALEDGKVVALSINKPGEKDCVVRWRGSVNSFEDCDGTRLRSEQLARFETSIPTSGENDGILLVDLRTLQPPPTPIRSAG
jgi:hypothetical protein